MGTKAKSGASIEQVGKAQVVVFDKTGTITYGIPIVEEIIPFNSSNSDNNTNNNTDDILRKAASVEQLSSHPAAQALIKKAEEMKLGKLPIPTNFHEISGTGVEGDINGEHIVVGSQSLLENIENEKSVEHNDGKGYMMRSLLDTKKRQIRLNGRKMLGFIEISGTPIGIIVFGDQMHLFDSS